MTDEHAVFLLTDSFAITEPGCTSSPTRTSYTLSENIGELSFLSRRFTITVAVRVRLSLPAASEAINCEYKSCQPKIIIPAIPGSIGFCVEPYNMV